MTKTQETAEEKVVETPTEASEVKRMKVTRMILIMLSSHTL